MQVFPTAVGGMTRLKIVQKSLGVMSGSFVEPKATFGSLAETRTISVGLRWPGARVPSLGHVLRGLRRVVIGLRVRVSRGKGVGVAVVRVRVRKMVSRDRNILTC